jgi:hypothetical protein
MATWRRCTNIKGMRWRLAAALLAASALFVGARLQADERCGTADPASIAAAGHHAQQGLLPRSGAGHHRLAAPTVAAVPAPTRVLRADTHFTASERFAAVAPLRVFVEHRGARAPPRA